MSTTQKRCLFGEILEVNEEIEFPHVSLRTCRDFRQLTSCPFEGKL